MTKDCITYIKIQLQNHALKKYRIGRLNLQIDYRQQIPL